MIKRDIQKEHLYEAVKTLVESDSQHIHLNQAKLFTLFSIGFQYLLFRSTKTPGHYIIRIEDSMLCERLQRQAKDDTTRKFLTKMALPRKLKYGESTFHVDFFNVATWSNTKDLPATKVQGALIVKNTNNAPLIDDSSFKALSGDEEVVEIGLPKNYYLTSLDFVPKTIIIAMDENFDNREVVRFPFIKEEIKEKPAFGVKIAEDLVFDD
jgi:hypothetical protein